MSFVQYSHPLYLEDLAFVGSYVLAPCFPQLFCLHFSSLKTQLPLFQKDSITTEDISGGGNVGSSCFQDCWATSSTWAVLSLMVGEFFGLRKRTPLRYKMSLWRNVNIILLTMMWNEIKAGSSCIPIKGSVDAEVPERGHIVNGEVRLLWQRDPMVQ